MRQQYTLDKKGNMRRLAETSKRETEPLVTQTVVDNHVFSDEVIKHVKALRRRGTLRDVYQRAVDR